MELIPWRVEVESDGGSGAGPFTSLPATVSVGAVEVALDGDAAGGLSWRVANRGDRAVRVRSVAVVFRVADAVEPLRLFQNGYQSWSPGGVATFGVDRDPSTVARLEFAQAAYHADQRTTRDEELRSEWVALLRDADVRADHQPVLVAFDDGSTHDGVLRVRRADDGSIELWADALLGDAVLEPGVERRLHGIVLDERDGVDAAAKLDAWATGVGRTVDGRVGGRVGAPYQVGWCSWYHYFHDVTEEHLRANLAHAAAWPFEVFQLDDGYQAAIGDWLATNDKFPSTIEALAASIAAAGRRPGIWIAPFLAAPDSEVARAHPDWIARYEVDGADKGPLRTWLNPPWGGGEDGFMYGLDTTHPEVVAHLEGVARDLVDAGFTYLKLDFTFSPSVDGGWHDPTRTPAERVRAGYEAIRRGAGEDAFLLGCGVPLSNVVGVVDANRIGQDVAPLWSLDPSVEVVPGFLDVQPATQLAYGNTVVRSAMHRRLWINDPDCLMLRQRETELAPEAMRTWAHAVAVSGGMALVSDDLALLDDEARALLDDVVAIGRASDAAARAGAPASSPDLLDHRIPHRFAAAGYALEVDPVTGTSTLDRP